MRRYYPRVPLLPRFLFCLTGAVAFLLSGMVLVAPSLDSAAVPEEGWPRLVAVFAHDRAVRRIALAGAVGLLVTAFVFFRVPLRRRRRRGPPGPPWHDVVGA
jgi:hypothetical protein